jgi:hypothetical protein
LKDPTLNRLSIGPFLWEMLDDLGLSSFLHTTRTGSDRSALNSERVHKALREGKRMFVYSGHDSTLVPVLCALGLYDGTYYHHYSYHTLFLCISCTLQSGPLLGFSLYTSITQFLLILICYHTWHTRQVAPLCFSSHAGVCRDCCCRRCSCSC